MVDLVTVQDLFLAIRKDDREKFDVIITRYQCTDLCFGRFPVLSLCYLFGAKKIIKQYESHLLEVKSYKKVDENILIYQQILLLDYLLHIKHTYYIISEEYQHE